MRTYNTETRIQYKVIKRKKIIKLRKSKGYLFCLKINNNLTIINEIINAPKDFRLIENPILCSYFFNLLRSKDKCCIINGVKKFRISLAKVEEIDFATISILKCIFEEAKSYGIVFEGTLPKSQKCKDFLTNSGFLNNLYSSQDFHEIQIKGNGNYFSLEKKQGKLTKKDFENFENLSIEAYQHVFGVDGYSDQIITLLKEIGGNVIEWSNSYNQLWQIGFYKDNDRVIFNVTDLGKGILESLYISQKLKMIDLFFFRDSLQILSRAFERRYGSLSQEINRNKGLPSIKRIFDENKITNLIVVTNEVLLNFKQPKKSIILQKSNLKFHGTFYQWELDKNCIYHDK
ncbi:hypothetical protein [Rufibacter sp. LB8]|uniref:hypothetical protein n=1 Tax=Rufibacter sp. LB8 TaxID=2777781 RepID=UPI00178C4A75|nr:hypothetical protein [Rufibacter sp. LB8]